MPDVGRTESSTNGPLLRVESVTKSYGAHHVLRGIDFEIGPSEIVGLVGENGAGKSSIGHIIAGQTQADGGAMYVAGAPFAPTSPQDARTLGVGAIEQRIRLDDSLTVAQAIFRGTFQESRPHDELRRQARWILAEMGVGIEPDQLIADIPRPVHGLIEAARVLTDDTQVIIMDEVSAALTIREVGELHDVARRLARQGRSVIYISHRLPEVLALADRVMVLRDGLIVENAPSASFNSDVLAVSMLGQDVPTAERTRPDAAAPEIISITNLAVPERVNGIDLAVRVGEVVGLTGTRTSGVFEVAGAIVGETRSTYDHLEFHGRQREIASPADAAALRISYFAAGDDELGLDPSESIARNLMTSGWSEGSDFGAEVAALREVIALMQQLDLKASSIQARIGTLSGGEQQKLTLARWISVDSDLMVLNSPTRGLDVKSQAEMRTLLDEATSGGSGAIVISSDPNELAQWCDRVGIMVDGNLVEWVETDSTDPASLNERLMALDAG